MSDSSGPRRVLMVLASGELGGGATHVRQLIEGLDRREWLPSLACDPRGPLADEISALGVRVERLPLMGGRFRPGLWRRLRGTIDDVAPALVHAHGTRAALAAAQALGTSATVPLVYTEHGLSTDVARVAPLRALAALAERRVARRARAIVALNERAREEIRRIEPSAARKIHVVRHGVSSVDESAERREEARAELGVGPEHVVVLTIARLEAQKAPQDLVRAAKIVSDRVESPPVFAVIGDGPLRSETEALARSLGVDVRLLGARSDARRLLAAGDIFCISSHWESLPLSILEAMAAGLPVVATRVGGVDTLVVDGETGSLVPPRRPEALAERLITLVEHSSTRRRLGVAGRARQRERFSLASAVARTANVYEDALREDRCCAEPSAMAASDSGSEAR